MARYGVETKLDPEKTLEQAVAFFGGGGLGLDVVEHSACCAFFEGGGGHVRVMVSGGEKKTAVELETREWDYDVKQFMRRIA